ncbi:hypothetical protein VSU01S_09860 [Vibrio superstes NBRC 103154]|uniref:Uncharacterized protein n=1 Tax=Vibrio superstes NBRC 103154 TaxID=1219062 RepID=A0A511QN46_9VIBR|nr:hypothetical protein VSU01S_09860 [Vibrio superstes NBRC 103154]
MTNDTVTHSMSASLCHYYLGVIQLASNLNNPSSVCASSHQKNSLYLIKQPELKPKYKKQNRYSHRITYTF